MTRAYAHEGYPVSCTQTGGREATNANVVILEAARRAGIPVFFTRRLEIGPAMRLAELGWKRRRHWQLHTTPAGLPDANVIADELAPLDDEIVVPKPKPSAFFGTALDSYLTYHSVDTLIVTGMVTSGCVRATVIDAYMRHYYVIVPYETVADYSIFQHRTSLLDMHMKYADVVPLQEVLHHLEALEASRAAGADRLPVTAG
jgi:maleamate amidohydrolase